MGELRNTEDVNTEKQVYSNKITIDNIYNAIRCLSPENQVKILENYKLAELHFIFADNNGYKEYISNLFNVSKEYSERAMALTLLHSEALTESLGKRKIDMLEAMKQTYDWLSEEEKQKFCQDMLGRKEFFEGSCKMIMDAFEHASEVEKKGVSE